MNSSESIKEFWVKSKQWSWIWNQIKQN